MNVGCVLIDGSLLPASMPRSLNEAFVPFEMPPASPASLCFSAQPSRATPCTAVVAVAPRSATPAVLRRREPPSAGVAGARPPRPATAQNSSRTSVRTLGAFDQRSAPPPAPAPPAAASSPSPSSAVRSQTSTKPSATAAGVHHFGRISGPFPPTVAHRLLLSAPTAVIA